MTYPHKFGFSHFVRMFGPNNEPDFPRDWSLLDLVKRLKDQGILLYYEKQLRGLALELDAGLRYSLLSEIDSEKLVQAENKDRFSDLLVKLVKLDPKLCQDLAVQPGQKPLVWCPPQSMQKLISDLGHLGYGVNPQKLTIDKGSSFPFFRAQILKSSVFAGQNLETFSFYPIKAIRSEYYIAHLIKTFAEPQKLEDAFVLYHLLQRMDLDQRVLLDQLNWHAVERLALTLVAQMRQAWGGLINLQWENHLARKESQFRLKLLSRWVSLSDFIESKSTKRPWWIKSGFLWKKQNGFAKE